jgi:hypothetical protein
MFLGRQKHTQFRCIRTIATAPDRADNIKEKRHLAAHLFAGEKHERDAEVKIRQGKIRGIIGRTPGIPEETL